MRKLYPICCTFHGTGHIYVHPSLKTCTPMILRIDNVRPPLTSPLLRPHLINIRTDKSFVNDLKGKRTSVSFNRLKPACQFPVDLESTSLDHDSTIQPIPVTKSCWHVHFLKKLVHYI
ncbi:transposon Tf2-6 polyprotein [Nephila pilipes]|uniref:Transposon Tf2-6 polyprotein n=1 Tax=Nephila pilipes TaxID=299642 RepID=A0A8X6Q1S9_NEPPI|nr:transposon Tf2-6 polyprotein [Nephila pilipes]